MYQGPSLKELPVTGETLAASEQFTGRHQWVDTEETYAVWETDLLHPVRALEVNPSKLGMGIYPETARRGWFRTDTCLIPPPPGTLDDKFQLSSVRPPLLRENTSLMDHMPSMQDPCAA